MSISSGNNNLIGGTPLLGTLGSYGGSTQTVPLLPGSPAIGAGDATVCANTSGTAPVGGLDQRGVSRPSGSCDVGAYQEQGFTLAKTSGDNQSTAVSSAFASPLVVTVSSSQGEPVAGGNVTFTGPASGAGIQSSPLTASIGSAGQASQSVTANSTLGGPYTVSATAARASPTISFSLINSVRTTGITVACSPNSVAAGVATTCTATVSDTDTGTAGTPTGTVSLTSTGTGSFTGSPCTLAPVSGSTPPRASCQATYTPSAGTNQSITADYAGDSSHTGSSGTTSLAILASPAVQLSAGLLNGLNGSFTSNPVASVTASSQTAGATISTISCPGAIVASFTPAAAVNAAVNLSSDGSPSLSCTATDSNGTPGTSNAITLKLDSTKPSLTVAAKKADGTAYTTGTLTNQVVTVTFTCSDAVSGVLIAPASPQTFSADGLTQTASASCIDRAGNVQTAVSAINGSPVTPVASFGPIKIDRTPPSCSASVSPSLLYPADSSLVPVAATVTTSDALSGPATWALTGVSSSETGTLSTDMQGFTLNSPLASGASTSGKLAATVLTSTGRVYTLNFQAKDGAGNTSTCVATVSVPVSSSNAPLVGAMVSLTVVEGTPFAGVLAAFLDKTCTSGDAFSASIAWGDGATGTGLPVNGCTTVGTVSGTHTYAIAGSYPLSVTITNLNKAGHTITLSGTLLVQDAPITGSGLAVSAVEGTAVVAAVASFTDANAWASASSYHASIDWGDGSTPMAGTVLSTTTVGSFTVQGSHKYAEAGSYRIMTTLTDTGGSTVTVSSLATVADAALSGYGGFVSGTHGVALASTTLVALLRDANTAAPASEFTAIIDWGDGSQSLGSVTATTTAGSFNVTGGHTYAAKGTYTVKVTVKDQDGASVTLTASASMS